MRWQGVVTQAFTGVVTHLRRVAHEPQELVDVEGGLLPRLAGGGGGEEGGAHRHSERSERLRHMRALCALCATLHAVRAQGGAIVGGAGRVVVGSPLDVAVGERGAVAEPRRALGAPYILFDQVKASGQPMTFAAREGEDVDELVDELAELNGLDYSKRKKLRAMVVKVMGKCGRRLSSAPVRSARLYIHWPLGIC